MLASVVVTAVAAFSPLAVPAPSREDVRATRLAVVTLSTGAERTLRRGQVQSRGWDSVRFAAGGAVRAVRRGTLDPEGRRVVTWRRDGPAVVEIRSLAGSAPARRIRLGRGRLGQRVEAAWSPDGRRVAVAWTRSSDDRTFLTLVDVERARRVNVRRLAGDFDLTEAAWSPDGRQVALTVQTYFWLDAAGEDPYPTIQGVQQGEPTTRDELWVLDADSGRAQVRARPDGSLLGVAWSQGDRLAGVFEFQQLSLVEGDRLERVPLAQDWCDEVHALAWSPDGGSIAVAHAQDFGGDDVLLTVVSPGGAQRVVRSLGKGEVNALAFSPDGRRLVYAITGHRP